jgi:large repetitive protein
VASATTGTPTGSVTFYDNNISLGTVQLNAGVASFTASALAPGSMHSITATYSGDTNFTASSTTASLTITVAQLEFTLTINGATIESVYPGGTVTYSFQVAPEYGQYAGPMTFAVSGLPSGVTATFSPDSIPANGGPQTVTLTITDVPLSAAANSPKGLSTRLAPFALALLLPLAGTRRMRRHGRRMRQMLWVLALAVSALSATVLSGCGSANGFFAQAPRNYNLTITATAGTIQQTGQVTLNVQ